MSDFSFLKLTQPDEKPIGIFLSKLIGFYPNENTHRNCSLIVNETDADGELIEYYVKETWEEVAAAIENLTE